MSIIIFGRIIHCLAPYSLKVIHDGFVIVETSGKILAVDDVSNLAATEKRLKTPRTEVITLKKSQLLLPGLIDTHIHAPQYPNVGLGYDKPLLEWLEHYTYKLEKQFKNQELCQNVFNAVVRKTLDHGTTTACYFGSLYRNSTLILAKAATAHGQRALIGKVNMTQLAPDDYIETYQESIDNTLKFVQDVKSIGNSLVQPIITPRFALSVDMDLMKELAKIAQEEGLNIQSHIAENKDELLKVHELYNEAYAKVYDEANLLTPKTVLAHGIYLSDEELKLIAKRGTSISHCPDSNTSLHSGLCDVVKLRSYGINVGLGTDVSGGSSLSIIHTMKAAIGVSNHISFIKENYTPLNYVDVFYLATLGGAKALALDGQVGNFEVGKNFDAIIADLDVKNSSADCVFDNYTPEELLQKLVYVGDDRNIIKVFVNGKTVK